MVACSVAVPHPVVRVEVSEYEGITVDVEAVEEVAYSMLPWGVQVIDRERGCGCVHGGGGGGGGGGGSLLGGGTCWASRGGCTCGAS